MLRRRVVATRCYERAVTLAVRESVDAVMPRCLIFDAVTLRTMMAIGHAATLLTFAPLLRAQAIEQAKYDIGAARDAMA